MNIKNLIKECIVEHLKEALLEGFDPTSAGPNPAATEGSQFNPYPAMNSKMRKMEENSFENVLGYTPNGMHGIVCSDCKKRGQLDVGRYGNILAAMGASGWKERWKGGYSKHLCPDCSSVPQIKETATATPETMTVDEAKEKIYTALEALRFQRKQGNDFDYMTFYVYNYATVDCCVREDVNSIHIEKYYDSERLSERNFVKKIPIPTPITSIFTDKIINVCELLKKSAIGDESIEGGMDDLNESTLSDEDVDMVEYVNQRQGEQPFTLKTGNGQEKFEYVNGKYPSGKVDIAVYAFRGDVTYGYHYFRKLFKIRWRILFKIFEYRKK